MYYEEKLINGVLHWRGSPDDGWTPCTLAELSDRALKFEQLYYSLINEICIKSDDESRHQTALKYIRQAENGNSQTGQVSGL